MDRHLGRPVQGSGHWMSSLLDALAQQPGLQLGVLTAWDCPRAVQTLDNGVAHELIPGPEDAPLSRWEGALLDAIRRFAPDLIHVHGSERAYGLIGARHRLDVPLAINIQGLMRTIVPVYYGSLGWREILRTLRPRDLLTGHSLPAQRQRYRHRIPQETEILRHNRYFMGQTDWDEAHVRAVNPDARYFRIGRVLRAPFYETRWTRQGCQPHRILVTNVRNPFRDTETILTAVHLLRREFPGVRLAIAGTVSTATGYGRFVRTRMGTLGDGVDILGWIPAERLAAELAASHVFVVASHVENESNALCEAMRVGTPAVASFAGGMPTMMQHEHSGLFFPRGDAALLAHRIRAIFRDDALANALSTHARTDATTRHDPRTVANRVMEVYGDILRAELGGRTR